MKRRSFIRLSIFAVLGIAVTSVFVFNSFDSVVLKILKADLKGLKIKDDEFKKFITEAQTSGNASKVIFDKKKRAFIFTVFFLPKMGLPFELKYIELRQRIVSDFLLATDFFVNKMDVKREIKYLALFDPYTRPCQNPFTAINYPAES